MTEEAGTTFQRGLSEWWSEETEYVFQRIERWAAFARGYNRLRSQRLSRGRMTMQEEQEPSWSISSNKLIIDDSSWSPRFHNLKKSRRQSRPEEAKINCCGTFNYQSNSNLDNSCLETYRYDHSIYFKTIGDIRNSKGDPGDKNETEDRISISSEELVEWDVMSVSDFIANHFSDDELASQEIKDGFDSLESSNQEADRFNSNAWPIVDLGKLDLNLGNMIDASMDEQNNEKNAMICKEEEESNNNYAEDGESIEEVSLCNRTEFSSDTTDAVNKGDERSRDGVKTYLSFRRTRRPSRTMNQPLDYGDNDVIWSGVLFNYAKNVDTFASPHQRRKAQI